MLADNDIAKLPAKNQSPVPFPPLQKIKNKEPTAKRTGQLENR